MTEPSRPNPQQPDDGLNSPALDATVELLGRAQSGDPEAVNLLFSRYLPPLRRWARGRLPQYARDLLETEDLVQETMVHAFRRLKGFEMRHDGALHAYLRQAVINRIRDEVRRAQRRPAPEELQADQHEDKTASPLETAIGTQAVERYEGALSRLRDEDRQAIVARVELGLSYAEVATALGKSSPDAARMAVARALVKLAQEMGKAT